MQGQEAEPKQNIVSDGFFWSVAVWELIMLVCYISFVDYSDDADGRKPVGTVHSRIYPLFQDVHIMIFIGFGFLMTFLRKYGFSSVGYNFLMAALAIQWGTLTVGISHMIWKDNYANMQLSVLSMVEGDFAAGAVLITFGAVLGKISVTQLMWMVFWELIVYAVNLQIVVETCEAVDVGGSMVIHAFGAFFGLGVARMITPVDVGLRDGDNKSVYHSDLFAMIGTIFLWCFWPSFNGALADDSANKQHRVFINTYFSLTGSCVAAFLCSKLLRGGKFDMVDVQNATLAGGVAVGSAADLMIRPWGALVIGLLGGTLSAYGFARISHQLEDKLRIHDTCGVNNLHGMPGILGGLAAAIAVIAIDDEDYGTSLTDVFGARVDRSRMDQFWYQLLALLSSVGLAFVGGTLTGAFLNLPMFVKPQVLFSDANHWEVPEEEIPMYHAHSEPGAWSSQYPLATGREEDMPGVYTNEREMKEV